MSELNLTQKRVLIRLDLNVPMKEGSITSDARLLAALPTIKLALKQNARVILMSHLGRPKEGSIDFAFSLKAVAEKLSFYLHQPVKLVAGLPDTAPDFGEVILCENVRFNVGEKANDLTLSKKMAALCDIFVMDAFASAHRAHASTVGVAEQSPVACAGPLLLGELENLSHLYEKPRRPLVAIVGGAKVSTKLQALYSLIENVDALILGGGIANTFLAAKGYPIGKSLYEPEKCAEARHLMELAMQKNVALPLPSDVVVSDFLLESSEPVVRQVSDVLPLESIFDIGPNTIKIFSKIILSAQTIIWNGPLGAFEFSPFSTGTKQVAEAISASGAFSVAGGGDTIAALERYCLPGSIGYISTGGGAFLEFLEGKTLPGIAALERYTDRL